MAKPAQGRIRIIGGQWRSRKLTVANVPGLRPSSDRIRETLFNWLGERIIGAHCLDLFAGSGALGIEALSRNAAHVVMLDNHPDVIEQLKLDQRELGFTNADIILADAKQWLRKQALRPFDIIFIDPPFDQALTSSICELLNVHHFVGPQTLIYSELAKRATVTYPDDWQLLRDKTTGNVRYQLWRGFG